MKNKYKTEVNKKLLFMSLITYRHKLRLWGKIQSKIHPHVQ